jgi:hypothetical protein
LGGERVAEKDDVGVRVLAEDGQGFAVEREVEAGDLVGRKMGELAPDRAVEGLEPEIFDAFLADGIEERFAVGSVTWAGGDVWIGLEEAGLRLSALVEREESKVLRKRTGDGPARGD